MHLTDCINEASVSEGEVLVDSDIPVLLDSMAHDLFETRVDNLNFISSMDFRSLITESHKLEESGLGFLLIFLSHTSRGNVVKVLKPFEVGAGDTTTVNKHVWGADNASSGEDLFSGIGGGSVGTFKDGLYLD